MRGCVAWVLLLGPAALRAEMIQAPPLLQYAPNMLSNLIDQQQLPFQGALPAGSGTAILAFAQLLGLIAAWRSLSMAWSISSTSGTLHHQQHNASWGGVILMFIAGVLVFNIDKTMAMLAATFPGFPDLTSILSY